MDRGTIEIWSDIGCPWASLAVHRLHEARRRLGLEDEVRFDHHAFPLELINRRPTPKRVLDAEIPVVSALEPVLGWCGWTAPMHEYPSTTLPALEAVQAAKEQGIEASARLDRALRRAFYVDSRCISVVPVILDVAARAGLDHQALRTALDDGRARHMVSQDLASRSRRGVRGSPQVMTPDGGSWHNPGIRMHWIGTPGDGYPTVDRDDPSVYTDIVQRALAVSYARAG